MSEYSECDKLVNVSERSQLIGDFLSWLNSRGIQLCSIPLECDHTYFPVESSIETLLAEFFEIDLNKVEQERRLILERLRNAN